MWKTDRLKNRNFGSDRGTGETSGPGLGDSDGSSLAGRLLGMPRMGRRAFVGGLAGLALIVASCGSGGGATVGDHWHAAINIRVCGDSYTEPTSEGGVHTHGDNIIHLHPQRSSDSGKNATLDRYFEQGRMQIEPGMVQLPGERRYRDGDPCPNGDQGTLLVRANGQEIVEFLDYKPQDRDRIEVTFE